MLAPLPIFSARMLVEVSDLRNLIISRPNPNLLRGDTVAQLVADRRVALLVDSTDLPTWRQSLPDTVRLFSWNPSYLLPAVGNVRAALNALHAEPHQTLFVTESESDLSDVIPTRVGTALVGELTGDHFPDLILNDYGGLIRLDMRPGHRPGYLGEIAATTIGRGVYEGSSGIIVQRTFVRSPDIADRCSVVILGRYFAAQRDLRAEKHQPSRRILEMKRPGNEHGLVFGNAVAPLLSHIDRTRRLDVITRVPPRGVSDNLGDLLRRSTVWLDRKGDTAFANRVDPQAIRRTRECASQKSVGSFPNRADNVRGAFALNRHVSGSHILLFDDVVTSEYTAAECSRVLLAGGAEHITVLALAFNQASVMGLPKEVPCARAECDGHLVVRFNHQNHGAFWGCSRFHDGCTSPPVAWLDGLRSSNEMNTRQDLRDEWDIDF